MKASDDIAELLRLIEAGKYEEIKLFLDRSEKGRIAFIETLEVIRDKKRVEELKRQHGHQEIKFIQEGFGNERVEQRVKKKLR